MFQTSLWMINLCLVICSMYIVLKQHPIEMYIATIFISWNSPWFKLRYPSSKAKYFAASLPHSIEPRWRISRTGPTASSDSVAVIVETECCPHNWSARSSSQRKSQWLLKSWRSNSISILRSWLTQTCRKAQMNKSGIQGEGMAGAYDYSTGQRMLNWKLSSNFSSCCWRNTNLRCPDLRATFCYPNWIYCVRFSGTYVRFYLIIYI